MKFNVDLKTAVLDNARGPREGLHLAAECVHLRAFVYVSTAYAHATRDRIGGTVAERFYDAPMSPHAMIQLAESMSVEKMNEIAPTMISGWLNTYSFSKALAEEIIRTNDMNLPICIVRPTIVSSTYIDPVPGWLDMSCAFGLSGLIATVGLGIVHVTCMDVGKEINIVPADFVNNAIIVAASEAYRRKDLQHPAIYTVSCSRNPTTFGILLQNLMDNEKNMPLPKAMWHCFLIHTKNKLLYYIGVFFLHYIPAYIVDGVCLLLGKPRMLVKVYNKMDKFISTLNFLPISQWTFKDDNLQDLYKNLSLTDQQMFNMDVTTVNWEDKFRFWVMGIAKYLIRDEQKSYEYDLRKQKVLKICHYIFSALYLYLIWKLVNVFLSSCCTIGNFLSHNEI